MDEETGIVSIAIGHALDTAPSNPLRSTREQRILVSRTVEQLEAQLPQLSPRFYARLLAHEPAAHMALKGSDSFHQRKFVNLFLTFRNVKYLEQLAPVFLQMGMRHRGYHRNFQLFLPAIERALCDVLAETYESDWSHELQQAWAAAYADVSQLLVQAEEPLMAERRRGETGSWSGYDRRVGWSLRTDEGLLEAIGGESVIRRVHEVFYAGLFADPWLGLFFSGKSQQMLIEKQTEFMVSAFGGPHHYRGATPAIVHMHMNITDEQADLRERYLRWAICSQGIADDLADRWLAVDRLFRPSVVKQRTEDCVLVCMGQFAVQAVKPASYQVPHFLLPRAV